MRYAAFLLFCVSLSAQNSNGIISVPDSGSDKIHALQSVVIDAVEGKMRINVVEGHLNGTGDFVADRMMPEFTVDPEKQTMTDGEETRGFDGDPQEGRALSEAMDSLAIYGIKSFKWWASGKGIPKDAAKKQAAIFPQVWTFHDIYASIRDKAKGVPKDSPKKEAFPREQQCVTYATNPPSTECYNVEQQVRIPAPEVCDGCTINGPPETLRKLGVKGVPPPECNPCPFSDASIKPFAASKEEAELAALLSESGISAWGTEMIQGFSMKPEPIIGDPLR